MANLLPEHHCDGN